QATPLPTNLPERPLPGGFYTTPTNLGRSSNDYFGVVVDLNLSARFAITQGLGVSVGYNFLAWSGVERAAEQVSGTINPTFSPVLTGLAGPPAPTGPRVPTAPNDVTTMWMHGVNFGFDLRF